MTRYDHQFAATCPADGEAIVYFLTIKTDALIMAEDIAAFCRSHDAVFHEALADRLIEKFGGRQKLRATHQGVHITTTRVQP